MTDEVDREAHMTLWDPFLYSSQIGDPAQLPPGEANTRFSWDEQLLQMLVFDPAGADQYEDIELLGFIPHMHKRGVRMSIAITFGAEWNEVQPIELVASCQEGKVRAERNALLASHVPEAFPFLPGETGILSARFFTNGDSGLEHKPTTCTLRLQYSRIGAKEPKQEVFERWCLRDGVVTPGQCKG